MAGTAAGIAKANAARAEKRRQRELARLEMARAQREQRANEEPNEPDNEEPAESVGASLPSLEAVAAKPVKDQPDVMGIVLDHTAREAANTVYRVCSGRLRAPVAVRVQASLAVLQGRGFLGVKGGPGSPEDVDAQAAQVIAAVERAAGLRSRRDGAIDAEPVAETPKKP